jgi:nitrate reductase gamma subunit
MEAVELYYKPWTYFWVVQSAGLVLLAAGTAWKVSFYRRAGKQSLYEKPDYLMMLRAFIREVILQKQLAEKSITRWAAHIGIFYGFMGLLLLSAIAVILKFMPEGSAAGIYMTAGQGHNYYKLAGDFFGLIVLIGLVTAFIRRYVIRDRQLYTEPGDTIALVSLLVLVVTGFLLEAVRIALAAPAPELHYSFVGYSMAGIFRGMEGLAGLATGLWVFHATLNAMLLAYIPHSKFLHIVNSPVEIVLNASEEHMRGDLYA